MPILCLYILWVAQTTTFNIETIFNTNLGIKAWNYYELYTCKPDSSLLFQRSIYTQRGRWHIGRLGSKTGRSDTRGIPFSKNDLEVLSLY